VNNHHFPISIQKKKKKRGKEKKPRAECIPITIHSTRKEEKGKKEKKKGEERHPVSLPHIHLLVVKAVGKRPPSTLTHLRSVLLQTCGKKKKKKKRREKREDQPRE